MTSTGSKPVAVMIMTVDLDYGAFGAGPHQRSSTASLVVPMRTES